MLALTLHNLWSHKRRLLSTMLAITLGVSFLTGTLVLGDTMRATFANLFAQSNAGVDARIEPHRIETDLATQKALLDATVVDRIRGIEGVARAEGVIEGYGKLVGRNGKTVGSVGPPTVAGNWVDDAGLNPYRLAEGRLPQGPDEVVINRGAAKQGQLRVGDTTVVQTPTPVPVTIVGLSTFGDADSSSGLTYTAFTFEGAARHVLAQPGKITHVVVAAQPGVAQEDLVRRLVPVLPAGLDAKTGRQYAADQQTAINAQFLDFLTAFLTVFAGIALLVAAFSIYNTFTILVAQRSRDSALLRALGASRRQVLTSTLLESVAVGLLASIVGVIGGVGISLLLRRAFAAFGSDLPASGLTLKPGTVAIGLLTGTAVTMIAAFLPARRAARVAPIAALRDVAIDRTRHGLVRRAGGAFVLIAGIAASVAGVGGASPGLASIGTLATLIGVVVLGPVLVGPGIRVIGAPMRVVGVTGALASENARRNPRRTSSTAAALLVGVTVVTLFTVFASSLTASVAKSMQKSFGGDLIVTAGGLGGSGGFSPKLAADVSARPEVQAAVGFGQGAARVDGHDATIGVAEPTALLQILEIGVIRGSVEHLTTSQFAVSEKLARSRNWDVGTAVPVTFLDGTTTTFTIGAIFTGRDVIGDLTMSRAAWAPHGVQDLDMGVMVKLRDGTALAQGKAAVEAAAKPYAGTEVQDRQEYLDAVAAGINQSLGLVYVMLALAVVIALMGISNTLALSVLERRREIGLLRAVGETRRQVRAMIRRESIMIAVFGTLGGLGLGVFFGWAFVRSLASENLGVFAAPPGQLAIVLSVGAIAGVMAAVRPARQAARLDILGAIATG